MAKSKKNAANGLMALSSAAILAVYSAGYAKTDDAARRLADQTAQRHARTPEAVTSEIPLPPAVTATAAPSEATPSPGEPRQIATLNPLHSANPLPDATVLPAPAPEHQTATQTSAPGSGTGTTSFTAPGNPAPPNAAPTPEAAPPPKPKIDYFGVLTADMYKKPDDTPVDARWKNGTFYGWGSCNHGDIQAAVVIQDGKIDSTFIAQCLTRYSCDVISKLPDMAARRQSTKLDSVSGATESAEAFMQALDDALTKAKNPKYQAPVSQK